MLEDSTYENNYPAHLKTFYPNGQVKEESFSKNGKREGKYILYDERGRTLLKGNYLKDYEDGLWQYYSLKGNLEKEINFKEGSREGTYKEYHLSGNPYIIGQYLHNQKEGTWKYFNPEGETMQEITYKNGNQMQVTRYELKDTREKTKKWELACCSHSFSHSS